MDELQTCHPPEDGRSLELLQFSIASDSGGLASTLVSRMEMCLHVSHQFTTGYIMTLVRELFFSLEAVQRQVGLRRGSCSQIGGLPPSDEEEESTVVPAVTGGGGGKRGGRRTSSVPPLARWVEEWPVNNLDNVVTLNWASFKMQFDVVHSPLKESEDIWRQQWREHTTREEDPTDLELERFQVKCRNQVPAIKITWEGGELQADLPHFKSQPGPVAVGAGAHSVDTVGDLLLSLRQTLWSQLQLLQLGTHLDEMTLPDAPHCIKCGPDLSCRCTTSLRKRSLETLRKIWSEPKIWSCALWEGVELPDIIQVHYVWSPRCLYMEVENLQTLPPIQMQMNGCCRACYMSPVTGASLFPGCIHRTTSSLAPLLDPPSGAPQMPPVIPQEGGAHLFLPWM